MLTRFGRSKNSAITKRSGSRKRTIKLQPSSTPAHPVTRPKGSANSTGDVNRTGLSGIRDTLKLCHLEHVFNLLLEHRYPNTISNPYRTISDKIPAHSYSIELSARPRKETVNNLSQNDYGFA